MPEPFSSTAQIKALPSTAAAPGYTFTGDVDTGLFSPGSNQVAISTGGTQRLLIGADGSITSAGAFSFPLGSAAAPSLYPGSDTNTGIYSPGADQLALATNGAGRLFVDATGKVTITQLTTDIPSINIESDNDGRNRTILRFTDTDVAVAAGQSLGLIQFYGADTSGAGAGVKSTIGAYSESSNGDSYVTVSTSTSALNNQERLRITSDGKVGVGTSAPDSLFHISTSDANGPYVTLERTGSVIPRGGVAFKSNNAGTDYWGGKIVCGDNGSNGTLEFYSSYRSSSEPSTAAMTLLSTGRLGIGTTSPGMALHVGPGASSFTVPDGTGVNFTPQVFNSQTSGVAGLGVGVVDGTNNRRASLFVDQTNSIWGLSTSYSSGEPSFVIRAASNEHLRIDSSGRLLVGTSTSRQVNPSIAALQLQIEGTTYNSSSMSLVTNQNAADGSYIVLGKSRGTTLNSSTIVNSGDSLGAFWFCGADGTDLERGAVIEAVVDGTPGANDMPGRLVFSTTADGASSPTERMRITNGGLVRIQNGNTAFLELSNTGGYSGFHTVDGTAYTIGQNSDLRALRIGSGSGWLTTGVNLAAGGTSWGTYSDERLKEDIVELNGCLEQLSGIRCVTYRLKDVDEEGSKKRLGVLAQDLEGKFDEALNASRRSEDDDTEYLSVQYADLVPVLIKALQESKNRIEQLEAKVAALEAR